MENCPLTGKPCENTKNVAAKVGNVDVKICDNCLVSHLGNLGLPSLLSKVFAKLLFADTTSCKHCNTTVLQIQKTGKLGCPKCYDSFYEKLLPVFQKCQESDYHIGKKPKMTKENDIADLKSKLSSLIKEEKYEEAAIIRDKIKKLTVQCQPNQIPSNPCS